MSTLIEYLDFEMSRPVVLRYSQGPTNGIYPAADALSRFGESSVTALKNALDDDASGQIRRINAAKVLFAVVDNKPEAIRAIAKAGFILGIKVMRML
jgi:hypothetical protein